MLEEEIMTKWLSRKVQSSAQENIEQRNYEKTAAYKLRGLIENDYLTIEIT